ncbi:hypothetical protein J6590_036037 [Homalodisca vitripennis]|nr:hypothetical protein J6590_036037 [Homalodisca vitripennis]
MSACVGPVAPMYGKYYLGGWPNCDLTDEKDRDRRRTRNVRYEGHLGDNLLKVEGGPVSADSPCSCPGHVLWVSLELSRSDLSPQMATSP